MDGFNGILALMIYNLLLYLSKLTNVKGVIKEIADTIGYFGFNAFVDLGFSGKSMKIGLISIFLTAFLLGIIIAKIIRKIRKVEF